MLSGVVARIILGNEYGCHCGAPKVGGRLEPTDGRIVLPFHETASGIPLWRTMMKAAFGILALYVSIPLAIVAAQSIVAHEAAMAQNSAHAAVAQVVPAPVAQR
jgi:hypothetical protein